jgi:hypothetical protein
VSPTRKRDLLALLREARDLLDHDTDGASNHVRRTDGTYVFCAACDLEARIDAAVQPGGGED